MTDVTDAEPSDNFQVSDVLAEYRGAYNRGDKAKCEELREAWKKWQGEDSIHETVFGKP